MKSEVNCRKTHTYVAKGAAQTVADAAQLIGRLPNGWTLHSLVWNDGWIATVIGPVETLPPP